MMDYLRVKHHALAMKNFKTIGTSAVYGHENKIAPSWDEAIKKWKENFKET